VPTGIPLQVHLQVNSGGLEKKKTMSCRITVMNSSASQEHDMYKGMWGRRGEAVSPVQSSLQPCYKGPRLNYVRTIWICAGAYDAAATHPYPTGASASLLSSLLRPNQARVAWGTPGRAASASEECSRLQGGRLQLIQDLPRKRSSHNNKYQSTN